MLTEPLAIHGSTGPRLSVASTRASWVRYLDTGSRDPAHALGTWLESTVLHDNDVVGLRWQSGFFSAGALGYFVPLMARLRASNGIVRLLIGSNDGTTSRADVEALLLAVGPPRGHLRVGIVNFENAYFHPKTVHVVRDDGSEAAYVGSANLTSSGATSLHIEAAIALDTRNGDDRGVLADVAQAVDLWFETMPEGLYLVQLPDDLDELVTAGILNVPRAILAPRPGSSGAWRPGAAARLAGLVRLPPLGLGLSVVPPATIVAGTPGPPQVVPRITARVAATRRPTVAEQWDKPLTVSDAQRKSTGNQRGSITLVRAGHPINAQRYFRYQLFANARWLTGTTRTGEPMEIAAVPFRVRFLGRNLGTMDLQVTYAPNREASQDNYTSLLHLGALAPYILHSDVTGHRLELTRSTSGTFGLSIT